MRYIDKQGFLGRIYYQFAVVDLWERRGKHGATFPVFYIDVMKPDSGEWLALSVTIPWVKASIGFKYK